jgi:predicted methyltransferase
MKLLLLLALAGTWLPVAGADVAATDQGLATAIAGQHRTPEFARRDVARHPREVLEFFGISAALSVAEIWPSSGWWAEILAPYLKQDGHYYAVGYSLTAKRTPNWRKSMARELTDKFRSQPELYSGATITSLSVPEDTQIAPPGSLDLVLTFRNVHNWMKGDYAPGVFTAMFQALKPGGVLGLVEHRAPPGADIEFMKKSGYVSETHVVALAEAAGFKLLARSELNANPRDSRQHQAGVWTLPPSLRLCRGLKDQAEADDCMKNYRAIGESDRMTLKFIKPAH